MKTGNIEVKITLEQLNSLLQKISDLEFMVEKLNEKLQSIHKTKYDVSCRNCGLYMCVEHKNDNSIYYCDNCSHLALGGA